MHELGIVFHVIKQAEEVAEANKVQKVTKLTLEVGQVSGIELDYFRECFDWAIKKSKFMEECKLEIIVLEAITYCRTCKETYKTVEHGRICPFCNSKDTYLVVGDKVIIKDLEVI